MPLLFAWNSKCDFDFIGTPKSDYTWSSGPSWSLSDFYHRLKGTEWDFWEMFLMKSPRCKSLIVRDSLTANNLNQKGINAKYFGNPMMDFVDEKGEKVSYIIDFYRIILLIGSRFPEALNNLDRFLDCLKDLNLSKKIVILLPLSINSNERQIISYFKRYGYVKK